MDFLDVVRIDLRIIDKRVSVDYLIHFSHNFDYENEYFDETSYHIHAHFVDLNGGCETYFILNNNN